MENMNKEEMYMDLQEKLSRLAWLLHRHHLQSHAEHGPLADPTRGQGRVLALLKIQPEITTKHLSYLLGIRQQSLNELLNKLEKSGYVSRTPSETDKRVMVVRLTEKGRDEHYAYTDFGDMFGCLNADEQAAFAGYLDRVIAALEAQLGVGEDENGMDMFEHMHIMGEHMRENMSEEDIRNLRKMMAAKFGGFRGGRFGGPQGWHRGGANSGPHGRDCCNTQEEDE